MSFTSNDFPGAATTGFPSPAQDYRKAPLDLASLFSTNPIATFAFRAEGDGMRSGAGIWSGDPLVVDRSIDPRPGCVVVALLEGGFVVRRLVWFRSRFALEDDAARSPILLTEDLDVAIWGVVANGVRRFYPL